MKKWMMLLWVLMIVMNIGSITARAQDEPSQGESLRMLVNIEPITRKIWVDSLSSSNEAMFSSMDKKIAVITVIMLFVVVVLFFNWRSCRKLDKKFTEVTETVTTVQTKVDAKRLNKTVQLEVMVKGNKFIVICWEGSNRDGSICYYSPFLTLKNDWIVRNEKLMKKSLAGCIKGDKYSNQRDNLKKLEWIQEIS